SATIRSSRAAHVPNSPPMTTRTRCVTDRPSDPPQAAVTPYFHCMRASRGFLFWTTVTLVVVGLMRGVIVAFVWHVRGPTGPLLIAANVVVTLVWLPIAYV